MTRSGHCPRIRGGAKIGSTRHVEEGRDHEASDTPRPILTGLAVLTATAALLTPATAVAAGGAGGGVLAGTWTSTDVPDGSHQTLTITGSGNHVYSIVYVDDEATGACGGRPARLSGPGFVDGDSVLMVAPLVCLPGGNVLRERLAIGVQYDPETDSLVDDFGIVWSRAG